MVLPDRHARPLDPDGPCTCGVGPEDEFGNRDLLESFDCPIHGVYRCPSCGGIMEHVVGCDRQDAAR